MYNVSTLNPNMKYLHNNNNNNNFLLKKSISIYLYRAPVDKKDDMIIHYIMWGPRLCKKQSTDLSFQCSHD